MQKPKCGLHNRKSKQTDSGADKRQEYGGLRCSGPRLNRWFHQQEITCTWTHFGSSWGIVSMQESLVGRTHGRLATTIPSERPRGAFPSTQPQLRMQPFNTWKVGRTLFILFKVLNRLSHIRDTVHMNVTGNSEARQPRLHDYRTEERLHIHANAHVSENPHPCFIGNFLKSTAYNAQLITSNECWQVDGKTESDNQCVTMHELRWMGEFLMCLE